MLRTYFSFARLSMCVMAAAFAVFLFYLFDSFVAGNTGSGEWFLIALTLGYGGCAPVFTLRNHRRLKRMADAANTVVEGRL